MWTSTGDPDVQEERRTFSGKFDGSGGRGFHGAHTAEEGAPAIRRRELPRGRRYHEDPRAVGHCMKLGGGRAPYNWTGARCCRSIPREDNFVGMPTFLYAARAVTVKEENGVLTLVSAGAAPLTLSYQGGDAIVERFVASDASLVRFDKTNGSVTRLRIDGGSSYLIHDRQR